MTGLPRPLSCADAVVALGAYVVGALDPSERDEVEGHLEACPACRAELAELRPLPALMARLPLDDVLAGPPAAGGDPLLLERLLAAAARERRDGRRHRWLAAAAAAVVVAGGVGTAVAVQAGSGATHTTTVSASRGPVHVQVALVSAPTGTALTLRLSGVPAEERCRLVAVSDTGVREVAGSWEATYSGTAVVHGTTGIARAHLRRLVIETDAGQELVSAAV